MPLQNDPSILELVVTAELIARRLFDRGQASAKLSGVENPEEFVPIGICYVESAALLNILAAARVKITGAPAGATLQ